MLIAPANAHPSAERLRLFGLGELHGSEADLIEAHVETCGDCCHTVLGLAEDPFLAQIRAAKVSTARYTNAPAEDAPHDEAGALSADLPPELRDHPRYRVFEVLGRGGMGAVYRAEHQLMERPVALKVLGRALTARPEMVERFRNEARAAARLRHPNIVQAFDADQADDVHFLVMEYVAGTDLARLLKANGPLPIAQACDFVRQAALGLQHAFENGMTHRDVKPHNLILAEDGTVKVLDFGLARVAREAEGSATGLTGEGVILGTIDYLAPEQADDPGAADVRSDIYALGCTLYHLLAGQVAFPGRLTRKLRDHAEKEPLPLRTLRPDVSARLAAIVARMMAKNPADRYATPGEVAGALAALPEPMRPLSRRKYLLAGSAVAVLAIAALIFGVYRITTDKGELLITVDDVAVEVAVKQNGKVVDIVDTKSNKSLRLAPGEYDLGLKAPDGFQLDVRKVTIRRGDRTLATVERVAKPAEVKPADEERREPFDPPPGLVWRLPNLGGRIHKPALSPDGSYVAVSSPDRKGEGVLYDLRTRREIGQFPSYGYQAFTVDGKYLVSNFERDRVALFRVPTRERIRVFNGSVSEILDLQVSPDGRHVLATNFGTSIVWDAETGESVHQRRWYGLFSHDGRHLIGLNFAGDKKVVLRIPSGELVQELPASPVWDIGATVLPGDRTLFRCNPENHQAEFWDLKTANKTASFDLGPAFHDHDLRGGAVSADGRRLLTGHADGYARLWDLTSRREVWRLPIDREAYGTTFSRDGRFAAAGDDRGTLFVWRLPDVDKPYPPAPKTLRTLPNGTREQEWNAHIHDTAYSPDGQQYLASGWDESMVRVWNAETGDLVRCLPGRAWARFTPDGKHVLAAQVDASIALIELATGKVVRRLKGHSKAPDHFDVSRDGKRVLSSSIDNTIRLWDLDNDKELDRVQWGSGQICRVVFSPDGMKAASRVDVNSRVVMLWDVSGDRLRRLQQWEVPGDEPFSQIRFTADSKELAAVALKAVYWFAAGAQKPVRTLPLDGPAEVSVHWCELSPDADKLVLVPAPKSDRTLRVLALPSGKELARFTAPAELFDLDPATWFGRPALSPDNRYLLVPTVDEKDRMARVYRFPFPR